MIKSYYPVATNVCIIIYDVIYDIEDKIKFSWNICGKVKKKNKASHRVAPTARLEELKMIMYEILDYDVWGNEEVEGIIFTDTSKSSICKKLGLDDPYKIDVYATNGGVIYVVYEGRFYCELREID